MIMDTQEAFEDLQQVGFQQEQAKVIVKLLRNTEARGITQSDLETLGTKIDAKFNVLNSRMTVLQWVVGLHFTFTVAILAKLFEVI